MASIRIAAAFIVIFVSQASAAISFSQALELVLTDNVSLEELARIKSDLKRGSRGPLDVTPILREIDRQSQMSGNDTLRVLELAKAVANSKVEAAIPIFEKRITSRSPAHEQYEAFLLRDIDSILEIAPDRLAITLEVEQLLMAKFLESPQDDTAATALIYGLKRLPTLSTLGYHFLKMQMMGGNPQIRHAATFTLVAKGSDAEIVSAWTQAISTHNEAVLIEVINALFIRPDLNNRPSLIFLIENANTWASPNLKLALDQVLSSINVDRLLKQTLSQLTQDQRARLKTGLPDFCEKALDPHSNAPRLRN